MSEKIMSENLIQELLISEVLLEFRCKYNGIDNISNKCVTVERFNSLKENIKNGTLGEKLQKIPYKDIFLSDDFVNRIKVIDDGNKVSAFKTLYGNSYNIGMDLLDVVFMANERETPLNFIYDSENEEEYQESFKNVFGYEEENEVETEEKKMIKDLENTIGLLSELKTRYSSDESLETDEDSDLDTETGEDYDEE